MLPRVSRRPKEWQGPLREGLIALGAARELAPPRGHLQVQWNKKRTKVSWGVHMNHKAEAPFYKSSPWEPCDDVLEERKRQGPPLLIVLKWSWEAHKEIDAEDPPWDLADKVRELVEDV